MPFVRIDLVRGRDKELLMRLIEDPCGGLGRILPAPLVELGASTVRQQVEPPEL